MNVLIAVLIALSVLLPGIYSSITTPNMPMVHTLSYNRLCITYCCTPVDFCTQGCMPRTRCGSVGTTAIDNDKQGASTQYIHAYFSASQSTNHSPQVDERWECHRYSFIIRNSPYDRKAMHPPKESFVSFVFFATFTKSRELEAPGEELTLRHKPVWRWP